MKMSLSQKLLLRYYRTQIKALAFISPQKAAEKAFAIFCTPYAGRTVKKIPLVFQQATNVSFKSEGIEVQGFRFLPVIPNGHKTLILHGFSSNAYKFDKFIKPLLEEGFEVMLLNAPAHGNSEGKMINALIYKKVILKAEKLFGPFNAFIGHSLGALAASLAFEQLPDQSKRKLVLVAPATETTTAVENFFKLIPVDKKTRAAFLRLITDIGGEDISHYSVSRAVRSITAPVLWVHDKEDTVCPYKDVKPVIKEAPPNVRFLITEHLGHSRIYKDTEVCAAICRFITENKS